MTIGLSRTIRRLCPLLVALACRREEPTGALPVQLPRTISVEGGSVALGEPIPPGLVLSSPAGGVAALRPAPAGQVERVTASVDAGGRVESVTSDFVHAVSYDSVRREYETTLGAPTVSRVVRQGEVPADVALWQDERTELRLVRDPNRNAWSVRAVLTDRGAGRVAPAVATR
jgi:hypothetical protein